MTAAVSFDHHYDYDELTATLHAWAASYPDLIQVESIGHSWQGRDIWLLTLTNRLSGPPDEKPGFLVEANIHAAELTSSFAALHLVHRLLSEYGADDRITLLLDTRTMYVVPRLNPDGAEAVLREGRFIRSSVRPYGEPQPGLHYRDIDGDGRMLFMRQPDPDGPWKTSDADARLLVRREPDEAGGDYYRLFVEGEIIGYDGVTVPVAEPYEGLDLGMNLQTDWVDMPDHPRSAGPFSGSEPEIHAMMRAVTDRPNLTGYVTCHTFGAIHLRPPMNDGEDIPAADLDVFEEFGARAESLTGYTAMSYQDLKHAPYRVKGGQINWFYHEVGVYAWITEFWNPLRAVGIEPYHPARWLLEHPESEALELIRWSDEELGGNGFVDWYPFEHPQLGAVELGGWDIINYWYNPPFDRIESEVEPHSDWVIYQALASPRLDVRSFTAERVAPETYRLRLVIANTGWLPTYVTQKALDRGLCDAITAEVEPGEGVRVLGGPVRRDLGQLEGRSRARTSTTWWGHDPGTPDLVATEWVVSATSGADVSVRVAQPRAGTARASVRLA